MDTTGYGAASRSISLHQGGLKHASQKALIASWPPLSLLLHPPSVVHYQHTLQTRKPISATEVRTVTSDVHSSAPLCECLESPSIPDTKLSLVFALLPSLLPAPQPSAQLKQNAALSPQRQPTLRRLVMQPCPQSDSYQRYARIPLCCLRTAALSLQHLFCHTSG